MEFSLWRIDYRSRPLRQRSQAPLRSTAIAAMRGRPAVFDQLGGSAPSRCRRCDGPRRNEPDLAVRVIETVGEQVPVLLPDAAACTTGPHCGRIPFRPRGRSILYGIRVLATVGFYCALAFWLP